MILKDVLKGIEYKIIQGCIDTEFREIQYDSRKVEKNDIFIAVQGFNVDGNTYIPSAIKNGANVIITDEDIQRIDDEVTLIKVNNTRKVMARIASNFYGNPSEKLKIIGITGTNGKTTTSYYLKNILENSGYKVGLIGTIANYINNIKIESSRTTPESLDLQKLFYEMVKAKTDYCIMEVSSHSIALDRILHTKFDIALFTNLTHEHLDFHKSMVNYYETKFKLLKNSKYAIINNDCYFAEMLKRDLDENNIEYCTFGINNKSNIKINPNEIDYKSYKFKIDGSEFSYHIPGEYNIYNSLGAIAIAKLIGLSYSTIANNMTLKYVPGRFERMKNDFNLPFEVVIDFAHTPDGLKNLLTSVRNENTNKIIAVYGCGGDKDKSKRAKLGEVGSKYSDIVIVTSDNPREEEPMNIINDISKGLQGSDYFIIENRKDAIKKAIEIARPGDTIVLAGKGHETYQINKDGVIPFNEKEIVLDLIKEKMS
ncbi:UDP-N-acetylmuramoyl-L-alanyl-D-glutamate--2,6-diaminopimelate ligase [Clostridium sp.]|uniref:UDP-N-acetylmuramoyl-L-alanyl-D-glutamate--2, 6-diaminopimelate ligase n=1 Tax=Clostridium sp. TaxID=1506 RepID=UPI001B59DE35|nr:UDP-N-acetylmuramoyl-L-alanyl-D-glutamate--2,6-diaminopimelate ligase [Clostridium sp.]MBP3916189.1 UDP-N-acetylmuramoyl-L-alanyl-D-glutamate--2,6-diaminopimelate ligase [Clostridium sp.]